MRVIATWWTTSMPFKSLTMTNCLTFISVRSSSKSWHCLMLPMLWASIYLWRYLRARDLPIIFLFTSGPDNQWWLLVKRISGRGHWRLHIHCTSGSRVLKTLLGWWTGKSSQAWRQFYDTCSRQVVTSHSSTPSNTKFVEHAISSQTWHHYKAYPVATTPIYHDLMQLDWSSLFLATIISQHGNGISIAFHELAYSMEDSQLASPTFLKYANTLPEVPWCLLYQVRFIPGSEQATLVECLWQKLHSHAYTHAMVCSFVSFPYYPIYLRRQIAKKIRLWHCLFASFVSLSQLIIVIWIKTSVGITTVFHMGISRAVAAA
jgi:hypothetical protein